MPPNPNLKAVFFDIGGVVVRSPLIAIAEYEKERGMPKDWINTLMYVLTPYPPRPSAPLPDFFLNFQFMGHHSTRTGSQGAWQRFERGEVDLFPFYQQFGYDLSNIERGKVWYAEYCKKRGLRASLLDIRLCTPPFQGFPTFLIAFPELPAAEKLKVDGREVDRFAITYLMGSKAVYQN